MGPMPWTVNSEIYPLWARSFGTSVATATNWTFNLLVSMTFLTLTDSIGKAGESVIRRLLSRTCLMYLYTVAGAFWLYTSLALVGCVFIALFLPETKGQRLEDVEGLFERRVHVCVSS